MENINIFSIIKKAKENTRTICHSEKHKEDGFLCFPNIPDSNEFVCIIENYFLQLPQENRQVFLNRLVDKIFEYEDWFFDVFDELEVFSCVSINLKIIECFKPIFGKMETADTKDYFYKEVNSKSAYFIGILNFMNTLFQIAEQYNLNFDNVKYPINRMFGIEISDTAKPQQLTIPDNLLNELQQAGFIENAVATPLNWKTTLKDLHYFINKYFSNEPSKWKKTINTFVFNNTPIKENSLKTAIDKYDSQPENATIIDNLLS
jgi:hypothetical protein